MIAIIVVGAVLLVSVVLVVVEGRVMRKPESERSERERRFLSRDRAVGRGYQSYARNIAPWIAVGAAVVGAVALLGSITGGGSPFAGVIMLAVGLIYLVLVVIQQRAEARR